MLKKATILLILQLFITNVVLLSDDKLPVNSEKSVKLGNVSPSKIYVRFKPGYTDALKLESNMAATVNFNAVNLITNKSVLKLVPVLAPVNTFTYNKSLAIKDKKQNTHAAANIMKSEEPLLRTFKLEYDGSISPERFCRMLLKTEEALEIAEPCYLNEVQGLPNDPLMEVQSYLKLIKAYDAWKNNIPGSDGNSTMVIAVSDNGIDQSHSDLEKSISPNKAEVPGNDKDDDGNGFIDDYKGYNFNHIADGNYDETYHYDAHGTNVTGIISATANNNTGICGVGYKCMLFPIKAGNDDGDVEWGYESIVYAAIRGFKVINCSWGYQYKDFSQIEQSIIDFAVQRDLAVVVASGNAKKSQSERFYPTLYSGVLGVGEVNQEDEVTENNCWNEGIDIMAPGSGNYSVSENNSYKYLSSGTSYASPVVAGVVGVVRAKHPTLTALQAIEFTRQCTDNIAQKPANANWEKFIPGRVNFEKAVTLDPMSIPAVRPVNVKFKNTQGSEIQRYFIGDTVVLDIDAFNYLGAANNLQFSISAIKDNLNQISIINDYLEVPSVPANSPLFLEGFSYVVAKSNKSRIYFRVDITGENGYRDFFLLTTVTNDDVHVFANNRIKFSVCDRGNFGFSPEDRGFRSGIGFVYKDYENQMYEGGIAASVDNLKIITSVNPGVESDFNVVKPYYGNDKFTNMLNDDISNTVNLEITQKLLFNEMGYDPCLKIEITAKNNSDSEIMNPSIGYYFDWDIADKYETNKIRLFPEAIPIELINRAAAHFMEYPYDGSYPVMGVMAFSNEASCSPQAASFQSSSTDPTKQLLWLNSGTDRKSVV